MIPPPFPRKHYLRFVHNKASRCDGLVSESIAHQIERQSQQKNQQSGNSGNVRRHFQYLLANAEHRAPIGIRREDSQSQKA